MNVGINPTLSCNLKCEYCFLHSVDSKKKIETQKDGMLHSADEWNDGLKWLSNTVERIHNLDIFGGEPLLHGEIINLINAVPMDVHIGLDTNATRYELLEGIDDERRKFMHLLISVHLDENGKIPERYQRAANKVNELGFVNVTVNFVAYPKQIKMIDEAKEFAEKNNFKFHVEPYINYNYEDKSVGYFATENDESYVWERLTESDKRGLMKLKKRKYPVKCFIGTSYLLVMENGNIFNCWGKMMAGEQPIGNIFKKEIKDIPDEIDCNVFCVCSQNWRDGFS